MGITTLSKVKTVLGITGNDSDAKITVLIPLVESDYERIRNKAFDTDDDGGVVYPKGSELTAIRMVSHLLNTESLSGTVQSESLSRYSVTYAERENGYPKGLVSEIKKYVGYV